MAESILRLRIQSGEYDNKLKQAVNGLLQMEAECRKVGGTLGVLEKDQLEYVKSLGQMETASKTAKGKVKELSNAYLNFALIYKRMSDEEKRDEGGKVLANSLTQLKSRLDAAKKDLADVEKEMNGASAAGVDFNSVLASLGQRFGINSELMGVLSSGTLATTAAVTAGAAAVAAATKMWADYNDELNRQTNVTTVTTGLKGDDAENLTIGVRALARTYDVDFREAINAANTLIQQFGVSGEQALSLLQDGMQGMIAGDGGKLLSMIQQYAPSFRDAGISASQLVAVIQNSEGGLFTDENMQAISMGIRNIRLMTAQTSNALAQLGIDGQEMSRKLEDGSMTIFDALRQVSGAIDNVDSGSKAAGEVMQSVFGRSGFQAGTKLGEAIATLNTNLEETKTQTGELGESFVRLNEANVRLEETMRELFGMTGWEDMSNTIKTELASSLSDAMDYLINVRNALYDIGTSDSFETLADAALRFAPALWPILNGLSIFSGMLEDIKQRWNGLFGGVEEKIGDNGTGTFKSIGSRLRQTVQNGIQASGLPRNMLEEVVVTPPSPKKNNQNKNNGGGKNGTKKETWAPIEMADLTLGMQKVQKVVEVTVDDAAALEQIHEIDGVTIADKGMTITATDEALPKLREIEGVKLSDKVVDVVVNDNSDFLFGRSRQDVQKDLQRAQKAYDIAPDEWTRAEARKDVTRYQKELETINGEGDVTKGLLADAYTHDFGKDMDTLAKELKNEQKTTQLSETEQVKQMGEMVGGIQQMVGGIAQLGIEIPEGFQSMLGGLQGIMTILQAIQTIQTVGSVLGLFRNGGIVPHAATGLMVPGNDFSDSTPVMVSSGELILNKAQQNAVAQGLQEERGRGDYSSTPYVDGEKIYLGMNNFLRRSGRGEIVTSRR